MKRIVTRVMLMVLTAALLLGLTACGKGPTYTVDSQIPADRPAPAVDALADYVLPWYVNAAEVSQKNGTMDFYFMSVNNYPMPSDSYFGDATVIFFPDGTTMLIDTGETEYAPLLVQNLQYLGVEKLDYLVFSHPHSDHSFAAFADGGVFDSFPVENVCWNGALNVGWSDMHRISAAAKEHGCNEIIWHAGDTLDIGEVHMEVLAPLENVEGKEFLGDKAVNTTSLIMRFDYGETSALFTGDLYEKGELELIESCGDKLDVDLLKVPHHGRTTSSSRAFCEATSPQIAVAMGVTDLAGSIYYNYAQGGTHFYGENMDGYVHVTSNGKYLSAVASHERNTDEFAHYESMAE